MRRYIDAVLEDGIDFGTIPGVDKPFLWKSGAQKLCLLFGYVPHYEPKMEIEDWGGEKFGEPLFYYKYACTLAKDGKAVGEGIGSASSWESKYRYRWVRAEDVPVRYAERIGDLPTRPGTISEFAFAVDKAETSGKYGKPAEYWARWEEAIRTGEARLFKKKTGTGKELEAYEMGAALYRVPNDQFPDLINTCQKQAEKRSYVEATLSATGLSGLFTQDEEGVVDLPSVDELKRQASAIDTGGFASGTREAAKHVGEQKLAAMKADSAPKTWRVMGELCRDYATVRQEIGEVAYLDLMREYGWKTTRDIVAAYDRGDKKVMGRAAECYGKMLSQRREVA
jgi:hypothetical protein